MTFGRAGGSSLPVEVHCRFDGPDGAPVVLLSNSLGTALEMWDGQVDVVARDFQVLRYDYRGHVRSPLPEGPYSIDDLGNDVVALLDRLGIERVSFCGLSLGGMVGMWLAAHAPERIERLVLCCTSARFGSEDMWLQRAADVRRGGMDAIADAVLKRWFTEGFRDSSSEVVADALRMLKATPAEGYARCCEALSEADMSDHLGMIQAPTLVIAGAEDPVSPPDHARSLQDSIPQAILVILPAAHLANLERPDDFTSALVEHVKGGAG